MSKRNMICNMFSLHKKLLVRAANISARNLFTSRVFRKNLYETLGVARDATQADIKNAYFELSKLYHPDRIAATDENLAKFREVSAAYEILGNEQSRKLYDHGLIGDLKRGPVEDAEETTDPIIKFYAKRMQDRKADKTDEMDAWAQTFYAEAKKRAAKRHQLFEKSERPVKITNDFEDHWLDFAVLVFITILWISSFEGSRPRVIFGKVRSFLSQ